MIFWLSFKMAISSILSNKLRTFLTMLGVIIGVSAVIIAVGFAEGSTKSITSNIESIGTNMLTVNLMGRRTSDVTYDVVAEELDKIDEIENYAPVLNGNVYIKNSKNTSISTNYVGTSENYATVQDKTVQEGRFLTSFDIKGSLNVAVVGTYVANELFPDGDVVGSYVKFNNKISKLLEY